MRALKIIGWGLAAVMLLLAVIVGTVAIGGAPLIAKLIETRVSSQLGREIRVGRLDVTWGSPIRIHAEDVHVANAAWGAAPDLFRARRVDAALDPGALFHLRLAIGSLELAEPVLSLEISAADGSGNWEGLFSKMASKRAGTAEVLRLAIHQGSITQRNGRTGAETDLFAEELVAETPDRLHPIDIAARGLFQQQPFSLKAELAPLAELHRKSWPSPVRLDGRLGANAISLVGMAAEPLTLQNLDLRVDMAGQDLQRVLATLGVPIPRVPLYRLSGHLQRKDATWTIEELSGQIGGSQVSGGILVDAGGRVPYIRADLTASYLELADLKGFYGGEPGATPSANGRSRKSEAEQERRLIPDFRIPVERLLGFDADFTLDAPWVKPSAGIPFERLSFGVALKDGTLRIRQARLAVARGEVVADLEYGSTGTPPRLSAELDVRRIDLQRLFAGMDVAPSMKQTAGLVGGFAKLHSAGERQRQLLAQLDGDIGLFVQEGRVAGRLTDLVDLGIAEALGLAAKDQSPLPIHCLIARFGVAEGIATADTLLLATPSTVVVGVGNINLADETLFLDLKPYQKRGDNSLGNVRVPIKIRGTFARPDISADKGSLASRLGAALGLTPEPIPATLRPFIERGLGSNNVCAASFAAGPAEGSSTAPAPRTRK